MISITHFQLKRVPILNTWGQNAMSICVKHFLNLRSNHHWLGENCKKFKVVYINLFMFTNGFATEILCRFPLTELVFRILVGRKLKSSFFLYWMPLLVLEIIMWEHIWVNLREKQLNIGLHLQCQYRQLVSALT